MLENSRGNGRPKRRRRGAAAKAKQYLFYKDLLSKGFKRVDIRERMVNKFGLKYALSLRTMGKAALEENQTSLMEFTLHQVHQDQMRPSSDSYGLLLELLARMYDRDADGDRSWFLCRGNTEPPPVTENEVKWYCRLAQLGSGLNPDSLYLLSLVYSFREECRQLNKNQLANPEQAFYWDDLDLFVAFKPWSDKDSHLRYIRAMADDPAINISIQEFYSVVERKLGSPKHSDIGDTINDIGYMDGYLPGPIDFSQVLYEHQDILSDDSPYPDLFDHLVRLPTPVDLLALWKLDSLLAKVNPIEDINSDYSFEYEDPNLTILGIKRRKKFVKLINDHWATEPPFNYDYSTLKSGNIYPWIMIFYQPALDEEFDDMWDEKQWRRLLVAIQSDGVDPKIAAHLGDLIKSLF